jgi:hypothetical protein
MAASDPERKVLDAADALGATDDEDGPIRSLKADRTGANQARYRST